MVLEADPSTGVDDRFIEELVSRAQADGLQLTGEGGLLQQLTKRLLESALDDEMTGHVGYDKHDAAGKNGGNSRNGKRSKTVLTDVGPVEIEVPRDREGSFEPQIVKKRQRRLSGVDEMVLSLSAKGLTHGAISAHLAEVYGAESCKTTISTITDGVMEGMSDWQNRATQQPGPLDTTSDEDIDEQCAVNFRSHWTAMTVEAALMRRGGGGAIVNTSSIGSRRTNPALPV
jgi:NAD(P)-dependent dehydrogenase (short-subunit alcohol dehydrogenase family)